MVDFVRKRERVRNLKILKEGEAFMSLKKGKNVLGAILFSGAVFFLSFHPIFAQQEMAQKQPRWLELGDKVEASEIDPSQYPVFTRWLDEHGKSPLEYALDKCREHQVVIFGELHDTKDYLDFFLQLIPEAYHKAGVRYVILEVCRYEDNDKIEKLIEGATYDKALALEIARSGPWASWRSKEYWDIFEVVWKLNKSLQAGAEHMKVIGMNFSADLTLNHLYLNNKLKDEALIEKARAQRPLLYVDDELMAAAVEETVMKNKAKGMVWVGRNHSFTHYAQPAVNADGIFVHDWPRLGFLLHQNFQNRIFQISFHGSDSYDSPKEIYEKYNGEKPVLSGLIEKIMAERGNKPVGFDVCPSPFANIRDGHSISYYFQPNVRFSDITQGYIFIAPWDKISNCQKIKNFISDEMFKKYKLFYETIYKRNFKNAREMNEFLDKD
jgi:hypothetical protein